MHHDISVQNLVTALHLGMITFAQYLELYRKLKETV